MKKFCVFGNPIAQSKSPIIHQMFAQQVGIDIQYERTLAKPEDFTQKLEAFFTDHQAQGCNITAPFKEQASQWVTELSPAAALAGAVNTIIKSAQGHFIGETTDGVGLVQDLMRLGVQLEQANILLLGAGGAARGVLQPILAKKPQLLVVANRTEAKAKHLASLIPQGNFRAMSFAQLVGFQQSFDLIINSTSASLTGQLPDIPDSTFTSCQYAYDLSYADKPTVFTQHANSLGVKHAFDGLGMLVGQAAESFYLWTGQRPDVQPVIQALRASL